MEFRGNDWILFLCMLSDGCSICLVSFFVQYFLWFAGKLLNSSKCWERFFLWLVTYCSRSAHSRSQSGHWNSMRPSSSLSRSASVEIFRSPLLFCKSLAEPKSSSAAPLCWEPANIQLNQKKWKMITELCYERVD